MIRITVWNENLHEKSDPEVRANHPNGLHETVAEALREDPEFVVRTATLDDPDCGLTDEVLSETDVLFWWGHMGHDKVPDEVVDFLWVSLAHPPFTSSIFGTGARLPGVFPVP